MVGATEEATLSGLRDRYVEQLITGDAREAQRVVTTALHMAPAAAVCQSVLVEALYEIGRRWACGAVSVAEEHVATGICEVVLPQIAYHLPRQPRRRRTAIVACAPGELHAIGSRVVSDHLDAAGWDVLHVGAHTPAGALTELVVSRSAEVVALSAATDERLPEVREVLSCLRALPHEPFVVLGGQAFATADAVRSLDGAACVRTPEALARELEARFPAAA